MRDHTVIHSIIFILSLFWKDSEIVNTMVLRILVAQPLGTWHHDSCQYEGRVPSSKPCALKLAQIHVTVCMYIWINVRLLTYIDIKKKRTDTYAWLSNVCQLDYISYYIFGVREKQRREARIYIEKGKYVYTDTQSKGQRHTINVIHVYCMYR